MDTKFSVMTLADCLPDGNGTFVGRAWRENEGPIITAAHQGRFFDITKNVGTMSRLLGLANPLAEVRAAISKIDAVADIDEIRPKFATPDRSSLRLLAPCDLQVIKAAGVTFVTSLIERVIEERAAGDPAAAIDARRDINEILGGNLASIVPGSEEAARVKNVLLEKGFWSQYLEVGIGPDAEIFTKCAVLSAVGWGDEVGIMRDSQWNNPEPEIVLAVNSRGGVVGATLGNDANLRDWEGRSALLLSRAKDNNGSCAIGPMIRLFDEEFDMDSIRSEVVRLQIEGYDEFRLDDQSDMSLISRDPTDLVGQAISVNHAYPDGFMLFLGTMFAPTKDRRVTGMGFTHEVGDAVTISSPHLGKLVNRTNYSDVVPRWKFGIGEFTQNLASRGLL